MRVTGTIFAAATLAAASAFAGNPIPAATGYGVNGNGVLFNFDLATPGVVNTVGNVGFVPEGIDFRPGTDALYALDVGPNTTQLYRIDINTAVATPIGAGFTSAGANYDLTGNATFGFDFNPTTLQVDDSMRIRVVATNGTNLRLNSSTGSIAAVDTNLAFGNGNSPFIDAAAYINNTPTQGGTTVLYDMDSRNNALLVQNPANAGVVETVGPFGATITNSQSNIHFDIFTPLGSVDPTNDDDLGYAVLRRPDAPLGGVLGSYLLYSVNLDSGQITNGAVVGPVATPSDFTGGFSILPQVPEPASLSTLAALAIAGVRRRR
jgi:hypothetical protein